MRTPITFYQFDLDHDHVRAQGCNMQKLYDAIRDVCSGKTLHPRYADGPVPGGRGRCRLWLDPGWYMLYRCDVQLGKVYFIRTALVGEEE